MYPRALIFRTPSGEYRPATTPVAFFILELLGGVIAAFVFTIMHAQGYGSSISGTSKYDAEFVGTFVLVVTVGADPFRLADSRFAGQESLLPPFACVGNLRVVHTSRVGVGFRHWYSPPATKGACRYEGNKDASVSCTPHHSSRTRSGSSSSSLALGTRYAMWFKLA